MVAAMAIVSGPATGLSEIARMAGETVESWLRDYDGYRGLMVFTDEDCRRSIVITLWNTEDGARSRVSRAAMRDQVVAHAGMSVEAFEVYGVPVCDVVSP
jgi:heme-degrading monooxygenase HmoA